MQQTKAAKTHEPTGDSEHIAYGKDYTWSCTCGNTSAFVTSKTKATHQAQEHEKYCNGETTIDVTY